LRKLLYFVTVTSFFLFGAGQTIAQQGAAQLRDNFSLGVSGPSASVPAGTVAAAASSSSDAAGYSDEQGNASGSDASGVQDGPTPDAGNSSTGKQTKRILYIVPNFRSVSVDEKLPPQSSKEKFKLMLQDSFDYSSFIYVGMVAGASDIQRSYPEFGHGAAAYGRYYWHSFADNLSGNIMTEALLPSVLHEDPRYYTMGSGGIFKRSVYSVSRLVITRSDLTATNNAHNTFNFSEIVGNGAAAGLSGLYYPSQERTWTKTGQKWILQIGLDGVSNLFKEFWPDVNAHVFHFKD
jgi:hypothetical protein